MPAKHVTPDRPYALLLPRIFFTKNQYTMKTSLRFWMASLCCAFLTLPALTAQISMTPDRLGVGTTDPDYDLHVAGDAFIQSNLGALHIGYPNNGNIWRFTTINAGLDLLLRQKNAGLNAFTTRHKFFGNGDVAFGGNPGSSNARLELLQNSAITDPQILLTEQANDYARISFENTSNDRRWTLAGYVGNSAANSLFNIWHQEIGESGIDAISVRGNGQLGIYGYPTARLEIFQRSQTVGTGLRFDDGTANQDWDITHGFALRFHYGGNLRGFINASTGEYTQGSDRKLKEQIQSAPDFLDKVMKLQPKRYRYKQSTEQTGSIGFIAQEVAPLFPEFVHYSEADDLYGINYAGFSVVAIKAIQELKGELDERTKQVTDLEQRLARLEHMVATGNGNQNYLTLDGETGQADAATLLQNTPNPFTTVTAIDYRIPVDARSAELRITDVAGKAIRSQEIDQRGDVQTILDAAALSPGTYIYSLWVDGALVGSKKMVVQ
jgi:hypothetical protein